MSVRTTASQAPQTSDESRSRARTSGRARGDLRAFCRCAPYPGPQRHGAKDIGNLRSAPGTTDASKRTHARAAAL
jgi:hypothetical protein